MTKAAKNTPRNKNISKENYGNKILNIAKLFGRN